jgi:hypothetical protein
MKKFYGFLLVSLIALTGLAQDKTIYDANAEKRSVPGFHAVKVTHGIELLLKQGTEEAVAVSAEEKEQRDAIKTEVVNGELQIYVKQNLEKWWQQMRKKGVRIKAYVSFKTLDQIKGSAGSRTTLDGMITSPSLTLNLSSGATFTGNVSSARLDVDQSSGAQSKLEGKVQEMEITTTSGSQFNGYGLVADNVKARANSGSSVEMSINKVLVASAGSGASINYKGEAVQSTVSTNSGGKVKKST